MSVFAVSGCVGVGFAAEGAGWFVASSVLVVAGFGAVSDGSLPGFGLSSFSTGGASPDADEVGDVDGVVVAVLLDWA